MLCECGDKVGVVSLATGKVTGSIACEEDQVTSLALAPDNSSLVVALKSTSLQQYKWPGTVKTCHLLGGEGFLVMF